MEDAGDSSLFLSAVVMLVIDDHFAVLVNDFDCVL